MIDLSGDGAAKTGAAVVRAALRDLDLTWSEIDGGLFSVTLPGTQKLQTECALEVGRHGLAIRAFVARRPEENEAGVFGWLLERNLKLGMVAFARDRLGDIYLTGRLPVETLTPGAVDQLLGIVAEAADSSFNIILALGFADSIRREWRWRRARGESTANLAAFTHLDPGPAPS
ncbi:MAG: YbjN domain-containing protein [Microlunatus sp.]|nr:YbjN domain-containing protein [Microlunatus sp.]MDN5769433.1 YbjN domain-containing protein [Microlunatus sp.]